jgi:hypothetical protein
MSLWSAGRIFRWRVDELRASKCYRFLMSSFIRFLTGSTHSLNECVWQLLSEFSHNHVGKGRYPKTNPDISDGRRRNGKSENCIPRCQLSSYCYCHSLKLRQTPQDRRCSLFFKQIAVEDLSADYLLLKFLNHILSISPRCLHLYLQYSLHDPIHDCYPVCGPDWQLERVKSLKYVTEI